jgi:hypothetical protein
VKDSLAMATDEIDLPRRDAESFAGFQRSVGIERSKTEIELAQPSRGDRPLFGNMKDFLAGFSWEPNLCVTNESYVQTRRRAGDAG